MSKRMYHPCHKLSVPSAKIFWCRHCMQMFEDAISRWKHSKICRFNTGIKQKDQGGQVIQMYVKPDTISYTQNYLPGQTVIHKPQIKKKTAELKCVICNTKFYSLYDMREHVRYPCQRSTYKSAESDSDNESAVKEESVSFKIRRVELDNDSAVNSSTALSVLAEASKHVESLSHGELFRNQDPVEGCLPAITSVGHVVEVAPLYPNYNLVAGECIAAGSEFQRPEPRGDLEPISIVIQAEDGQDLPEASLDEESIANYLREAVQSFQVGQILQVQIKSQTVKYFVVGPRGIIYPAEPAPFPLEIKSETVETTEDTSTTTASIYNSSTSSVSATTSENPIVSDSSAESSLLLALASEQSVVFVKNTDPNTTTSSQQSDVIASPSQEQCLVSSNEAVQSHDILSQSVRQEILDTNNIHFITESEHSYQLPYAAQGQSHVTVENQPQLLGTICKNQPKPRDQANQVELDTLRTKQNFNQLDLQNLVSLVQRSVSQNQISAVETSGTVFPVYNIPNRHNQTATEVLEVGVPVVIQDKTDTEVVQDQAGEVLGSLVYTYAPSDNTTWPKKSNC